MAKTRSKIGRKDYAIIEQDESGSVVMFRIPLAAIYYDTDRVRLGAQDAIDDTVDQLVDASYLQSET